MAIQDCALSVVGKIAERCVDPFLRQFQYLFCYKSNVETLMDEMKELELKKDEVQRLVDEARNNAEEIKPIVTNWLQQVEDQKKEVEAIFEDMENKVKMNCFKVRLLNLKSRHFLGRDAAKRSNVVKKLVGSGQFDKVGYISPLGKMAYSESTQSLEGGLVTRMSTKKEVIEYLKHDKTSLLAICGMAGVGKTTLVKQIANQVKFEKLFDDVAMVVVSQNPDQRKIQNELAEQLGLTISEQTNHVRAERLHKRLNNDSGKRILVILDDIWTELDFQGLGIPFRVECKNLKVILTSRFPHVCSNMGAEIVEVNTLPEEEAWYIFKEVAGISDDSNLSNVAKLVSKECRGLPLAIVVVAKALKNKHTPDSWTAALRQIKKHTMRNLQGVEDLVFSTIEWSYNYLESVEAKSLLLLCSLFPEDYSIPTECLVRYGKGLELFQEETLGDIRDRVDMLIDDLKSYYLLLTDEKEDHVKLHDVVRDVCLSIASKREQVFLVRNVGVEERHQQLDSFSPCTAISLTLKGSVGLFPFGKECPRLKLLRLECQSSKLDLSIDSFMGMNDLKVVELKEAIIEFSLVGSGQMFMTLRTLCLDYCELGTGTSSMLGSLTKLEILSFFKSKLQGQFPTEIAQLSNLKLLDLRFERSLQPLPRGILSSLKKLEELYMGSHHHLQLGRDKEEERACLEEITSLSSLECLQIHMYDLNLLLQFLHEFPIQRLSRFRIVGADHDIGKRDLGHDYQFRRSFELHLFHVEDFKEVRDPSITSIVKRSKNLTLNLFNMSGLRNLVSDLDKDGFVNLARLNLESGNQECLIDSTTNLVARNVFENLVSMELIKLSLKEICHGNLPPRCFSQLQEVKLSNLSITYLWKGPVEPPSLCNLRVIEICDCTEMTTLFYQSTLRCLVKLQELIITGCHKLNSIVTREESINEKVLDLPELKVLYIEKSNQSMSFGSEDDIAGFFFNQALLRRLERLETSCGGNQIVGGEMPSGSLQNLNFLWVTDCSYTRCIAKADGVTLLQNLQTLVVFGCIDMKVLFDFEGLTVPTLPKKGLEILPKLESLQLVGTQLTHIWRNFPKAIGVFQNLRNIEVVGCSVQCLFHPPHVANMLVSLETLQIVDCEYMHGVIGGEDEEINQEENCSQQQHDHVGKQTEIVLERTNKEFVFPKLRSLKLHYLPQLQSFGGCHWEDCEFKFLSLIELQIKDCPRLKKLCSGKLNAQRLTQVKVTQNKVVPVDLMDREIIYFPR